MTTIKCLDKDILKECNENEIENFDNSAIAHQTLCMECGIFFNSSEYYDKNLHKCYSKSNDMIGVKCNICDKNFKNVKDMKEHQEIHSKKKFECELCKKKFSRKKYLNQHLNVHNGTLYHCSICEREFNNKSNLNKHCALHYEKTFRCHYCNKMFHTKQGLKKHSISKYCK